MTRAFARCVRLVGIHHHSPLELGDGTGYCVQTLERLTSPEQWRKLSPSAELMVNPERVSVRRPGHYRIWAGAVRAGIGGLV